MKSVRHFTGAGFYYFATQLYKFFRPVWLLLDLDQGILQHPEHILAPRLNTNHWHILSSPEFDLTVFQHLYHIRAFWSTIPLQNIPSTPSKGSHRLVPATRGKLHGSKALVCWIPKQDCGIEAGVVDNDCCNL